MSAQPRRAPLSKTLRSAFRHPLAAITRAITRSMVEPRTCRVVVNDKVVCLARDAVLLAADGERVITPAEVVRAAELAKLSGT